MLKNDTLSLCCNLHRTDHQAFQDACNQLCNSSHSALVMDLTKCTYMNSMLIGVLVDAVTGMKIAEKTVTVYVSPEIGRFLHMAHLYHIFEYEIAEPFLETP